MQNLSAREPNLTECGLCGYSPVIYPAVLPYVFISLPANVWVLWLMMSSPVFWTDRMDVSEFNMVLAELLFGFLGPSILTIRQFSELIVKDMMSKLINIIFMARIQFQTSLCVERYFAVVHPVLYLRYKPLRYRMSICCIIWIDATFFGIVQLYFCTGDVVSVAMNSSFFFLVFIINSFCCLSVLRALKQPSPGEGERERSNLIKKRAFNTILIFQMTTFFSYVPLVASYFLIKKIEWGTLCILLPLAYSLMIWFGVIHPLHYHRRAGKHLVLRYKFW